MYVHGAVKTGGVAISLADAGVVSTSSKLIVDGTASDHCSGSGSYWMNKDRGAQFILSLALSTIVSLPSVTRMLQSVWASETPSLGLTIMADFLSTVLSFVSENCFSLYDATQFSVQALGLILADEHAMCCLHGCSWNEPHELRHDTRSRPSEDL